jgi:hypothetical protein
LTCALSDAAPLNNAIPSKNKESFCLMMCFLLTLIKAIDMPLLHEEVNARIIGLSGTAPLSDVDDSSKMTTVTTVIAS